MNQEERINRIERSNRAVAVANLAGEYVREEQEKIIMELLSNYRAREFEQSNLFWFIGKIGELDALDKFMRHLEYEHQRGIDASEKEFGNGKTA